jgi:hypothetical protein
MNAPHPGDGVLVGVAAIAAFSAGLLAVAQHADCTTAGYRLAVAQRENLELRRGVDQVARRVDALLTPQAAMTRAAAMKLTSLKYPKTWNVASASTIQKNAVATVLPLPTFAPGVPMVPVSTKGSAR